MGWSSHHHLAPPVPPRLEVRRLRSARRRGPGQEERMTVRPARAWWRVALVALLAFVVAGAAVAAYAAKDKEPIRRIVYGTAEPQNAPGQAMNLQQVEIDPGAKLPEHFHAGTQIATIKEGVLTYQVGWG